MHQQQQQQQQQQPTKQGNGGANAIVDFTPDLRLKEDRNDDDDDARSANTESISVSTEELSSSSSQDDLVTEDDLALDAVERARLTKHVRFALEANQVHNADAQKDHQLPLLKKHVSFCLEKNEYYANIDDITEEECALCWYDKSFKETFREEAAQAARDVFLKKQGFMAWLRSDELELNETAEVILDTFETCSHVKTDSAMRTAATGHRQELLDVYYETDSVGLEHFILAPVRGEPEGLRKFVLDQVQFSVRRSNSSDQQDTAKTMQSTLAYVSQCMSRPSRLLSQEIARAHARAIELSP